MPPLPPNLTKAGLLRGLGGWNNSSLSLRNGTTSGLLSTRTPQGVGTTGGRNPEPEHWNRNDAAGDAEGGDGVVEASVATQECGM